MKKLLTITLAFCAVIVAMACGSNDPDVDGVTGATEQNGEGGEGTAKGKMLLVYFSRAGENWQVGYVERGNTAIMVDYIKDAADVDVFEILPEVAYPNDYMECVRYVNDVEIPQGLRSAYKDDVTNLSDYETVFVGGPIWCGQPPFIIRTFLEAHPELKDKTLIPFGTHGGSGVGSYTTLLKECFPNATVLESLGISGASIRDASSKQTVEDWLKRLGLDKQSTNNDDFDMEKAREEIEQYLRDWSQAMIDADTEALGSMMADDIILRHITGQTQTKQEWLEEVASGSMDYHEIENRDVSITFIDSQTADLAFTAVITATIWGSRGTWTLQSTMRLARRDGKWIRVNKDDTNAVRSVRASRSTPSAEYTLSGTPATNKKGIVIRDNKKYVKK